MIFSDYLKTFFYCGVIISRLRYPKKLS
uniref:Uncharacterized protein n=1 Tax=Arundo donax TaxID=35708 RepID=A0A0A8XXV0_ARUDO